jgi:hypothetical protein
MQEKYHKLQKATIKLEGYKMGKMKLGSNLQKRSIINTSYGDDDQNALDIQNMQQYQKEEKVCTFSISEIQVYYTGDESYGYRHNYNVSIEEYAIFLEHECLMQTTIYFDNYNIEDNIINFYNRKNIKVSSVTYLDKEGTDIFLSKFNQKILEGKALGLATYLKDKNLNSNEEKEYLEVIDPRIFLNAKKILVEWEIAKL